MFKLNLFPAETRPLLGFGGYCKFCVRESLSAVLAIVAVAGPSKPLRFTPLIIVS
jgi:hypothetical protein